MIQGKTLIIVIALASLVIGLGAGWLFFAGEKDVHTGHEHVVSDVMGEWTCSMHPQVRQNEPGSCPLCGMDLIPVNGNGEKNDNSLEIKMSNTAMQLANVQTAVVSKTHPAHTLRLSGKVQPDESTITSQVSHISGRIEKLLINTTGEYVKRGQVIAYIYSAELVTAQEELLEARKLSGSSPELLKAAREKLKNWKLTDEQITQLLKEDKPMNTFPILADQEGYVLSKRVNVGDYVKQGSPLYEVADLSRVWLLFDVYESDVDLINVGDVISYTVQSLPGRKFQGRISFIDPVIDPQTRVAKARVVSSNTDLELKPEMFTTGVLKSPTKKKEVMAIPRSAVMWTGKKSVVYVKSISSDKVGFMMREITTGAVLSDSIIVEEGLTEGEAIAIHGTFSIDAAAQLAGKPSMMNPSPEANKPKMKHQH